MPVTKIKVPRPPKRAFNMDRPASDLLKSQITHLEWATRPAAYRKPGKLRIKKVKTEGEAAARIERLTRELLRQQNALPPPADKPAEAPPPPKAGKRQGTRPATSRPKRRRGVHK
jgi:hypothetical protein